MFKNRKNARDMLERKKKSLNTYVNQYNKAVLAVTTIIDRLTQTSTNIDNTLAEIDAYQAALAETVEGLHEAKAKNENVIKNFRALLAD